MAKYRISASLTISVITEVEAASEEEAVSEAFGRPVIDLCHHCAGDESVGSEWVTTGELDGEPDDESVRVTRIR